MPTQCSQLVASGFGPFPAVHAVHKVRALSITLSHAMHLTPNCEYVCPMHAVQRDRLAEGSLPAVQGTHAVWRVLATLPCSLPQSSQAPPRLTEPMGHRVQSAVSVHVVFTGQKVPGSHLVSRQLVRWTSTTAGGSQCTHLMPTCEYVEPVHCSHRERAWFG